MLHLILNRIPKERKDEGEKEEGGKECQGVQGTAISAQWCMPAPSASCAVGSMEGATELRFRVSF